MPSLKAKVKVYPSERRDSLRARRGYLSISLSNRITTSELLLRAVVEWVRDNVASFDIVIGDSFHRHNLKDIHGLSQPAALSRAVLGGREVAHRVRGVLDTLTLSDVALLPTSDLSAAAEFPEHLAAFNKLYESHEQFRDLIDVATDAFLRRFAPHRMHTEEARRHSRSYQLEELAVFELLAADGHTVNVYPGAHLPVMKELVAGSLRGTIPAFNELILVEIRLRSTR